MRNCVQQIEWYNMWAPTAIGSAQNRVRNVKFASNGLHIMLCQHLLSFLFVAL